MLLERREFETWYREDAVDCINVYSDGSPVVGVELQGQLVDIWLTDGTRKRRTMPGTELSYGHCSSVAKCMALIWSIFLTAGPEEAKVRFFPKPHHVLHDRRGHGDQLGGDAGYIARLLQTYAGNAIV